MIGADGKTIARIEENSPRPWDGHPSEEYALIHLTDGTALEISAGAGYDGDGYPGIVILDAETVAKRQAAKAKYETELAEATAGVQ